jgi:hypothetical protein
MYAKDYSFPATCSRFLADGGVFAEMIITIAPRVLGSGCALFQGADVKLDLVASRLFAAGYMQLKYQKVQATLNNNQDLSDQCANQIISADTSTACTVSNKKNVHKGHNNASAH